MPMPTPENTSTPVSPLPAVEALLKTLDQERETVARLDAALTGQLDALQTNQQEPLMDATDEASRAAWALHRLHAVRERQTGFLARVLGTEASDAVALAETLATFDPRLADRLQTAQDGLRAQVSSTRAHADEVGFALHVAACIGQDMLLAWQHLDEAPNQIYTAGGTGSDVAPARSLVNQLG